MLYTSPHPEIQSNPIQPTYSTTVLHPSLTCYWFISSDNIVGSSERLIMSIKLCNREGAKTACIYLCSDYGNSNERRHGKGPVFNTFCFTLRLPLELKTITTEEHNDRMLSSSTYNTSLSSSICVVLCGENVLENWTYPGQVKGHILK